MNIAPIDAGVMIIIKDGLILSISRKEDHSIYGLIGGKCDPNETAKQAAIRETQEETSIVVHDCVEIYKRIEPPLKPNGLAFNSICFYATSWEGTPIDKEGLHVAWLTKEELINPKPIGKGAFPIFNREAIAILQKMFPEIVLK